MSKIIRLKSDFDDDLARMGYDMRQFARYAEIPPATLFGALRPEWYGQNRTLGGIRKTTAWKIVNAFSRLTGRDPQEVYTELIVEEQR